jgi:ketosteroid isomerase-like protein
MLLALAGLAMPVCAAAQNSDPLFTATRQQLDVVKVVIAQQDAWNKGDLDGYISHYKDAPDTQAVLANLVRGLENIRAAFHLNFPNKESMGNIDDSDVQVRALGENFALATGRYHLTRSKKGGGPIDGTFSELFEKTPAGWQIIFSEST